MKYWKFLLVMVSASILIGCGNNTSTSDSTTRADSIIQEAPKSASLREESVTYTGDGITMKGYIVYDSSVQGKRPAVLIIHEWWGLTDYLKMRARKLAELGYIAMAVDLFGNGKTVDNPSDAQKLSGPFYDNPQMAKARFDAALSKLKTISLVDTNNIAGTGYCFGGAMLLDIARMGENLKAAVSFHGNLIGTPADKNLLKAKLLICHGAADPFVKPQEVAQFKKQMDSIGADYTFKEYPNAMHAFTNPGIDAIAEKYKLPLRYNPAADSASWNDMKEFLGRVLK